MRALLAGSAGRTPFCGHFRGVRGRPTVRLAYAGRLRGSGTPEEGWAAAEAAHAALADVDAADRFALLDAAWAALRALDHRDLSLLMVADDGDGTAVAACGLEAVYGDGAPLVEAGHPLLGEPGVPERGGYFHPERPAERFVGVPVGCHYPEGNVLLGCGVRA